MPQIIVHSENDGRARVKAQLVNALRACLIETLELRPEQGQVMLYETLPIHRAVDEAKKGMIFVEIKMVFGRTDEMKHNLTDGIIEIISREMELEKSRVMCLIEEYEAKAYIIGK